MPTIRTALILALGALALPATATADPLRAVDYAVTIDGIGDYNRADVAAETAVQHDIGFGFRTTIPKITFYDNAAAADAAGTQGTVTITRGSYVIQGPTASARCHSHEVVGVKPGRLGAIRNAGATTFATRVIGDFSVDVGGCDVPMTWPRMDFGDGAPLGGGRFDSSFTVPSGRIGEAVMNFPLKGEATGTRCPLHLPITALCSLTWNATVTLTRTAVRDESDQVAPVPIVPDPKPAPKPEPKPVPQVDDDLLVPIVDDLVVPLAAKAKLAPSLSGASLPLMCPKGCRGTVTATASGRTLAKRAFTAAAGRTTTAALRFDAADRRAIRRARKVTLTVRARSGSRTIRKAVTLRARR
jgi:hypothetical protein